MREQSQGKTSSQWPVASGQSSVSPGTAEPRLGSSPPAELRSLTRLHRVLFPADFPAVPDRRRPAPPPQGWQEAAR